MVRYFSSSLGIFFVSMGLSAQTVQTHPMNDTGANKCNVGGVYTKAVCPGSGQDGEFGRDSFANVVSTDGHAGFSFVRVCNSGELEGVGSCVGVNGAPVALGSGASDWGCTKDKVTGLIWEVKTNDGGLRDKGYQYKYSSGDVQAYVTSVNQQGLCGAADWRVPNVHELASILDGGVDSGVVGAAAIDTKYFPNTSADPYWASNAGYPGYWDVVFDATDPAITTNWADQMYKLRLVRKGATVKYEAPRFARSGDGTEFTDKVTGLVWRRCLEGLSLAGNVCAGSAVSPASWDDALVYANNLAATTGKKWRLPNRNEFLSLVDTTVGYAPYADEINPGLDYYSNNVPSIWTSTIFGPLQAGYVSNAHIVNTVYGSIFKSARAASSMKMWLVR